jgi:hypothetical protein
MNTQIKCPYCHKQFEPTDAYKHELEEKLLREEQEKHKKELEKLAAEKEELAKSRTEEIEKIKKQVAETAKQEAKENLDKELKDKENQILSLKKRAEAAEEIELKVRKEKREFEESKRKFELEKQRQLDEEREKIRAKATKEAEEGQALKIAEKDKKLSDAEKQILELQRKIRQGSQQTQGEVMELEIENILRAEFPLDNIVEVKKGQRGADILQNVVDKKGRKCGGILWESKNAKWSQGWISKLKEDQRQAKAQLAVLIVTNPPEDIKGFVFREGIWVTTWKLVVPLAMALRFNLVNMFHEKAISVGKNEKMEVLYQYLTSVEFKHRVEGIVEAFGYLQTDIEREKRWFQTKWARQEKELRKVIDHTQGMYGDLQGVMGRALPEIKSLELPGKEE